MKTVLLLKAGDAQQAARLEAGDYDQWFIRSLGLTRFRFDVVRPYLGEALPAKPRDYDAVIMTGSPLSVTAPADWMKRSVDWMRDAADNRVPVLGVCFGHQLLGWSYGARVVVNPRGREIGTIDVALTPEGERDPLFADVPRRFFIQATHEDIVDRVPDEATLLASNENSLLQAMAIGKYVRGVQFHPELDAGGMGAVIRARANKLAAEGRDPNRLQLGIRPTPSGVRILTNFLERFT